MSDGDGLQSLAITDATSSPVGGPVSHYAFNEPGSWGLCPECRFEVTLDEDGRVRPHERMIGGMAKKECGKSRPEPITEHGDAVEHPTPTGDDHPRKD